MLSLIDQLPRNSRYRQALANDEEMAAAYLEEFDIDIEEENASARDDEGRPEMADFSLEAELLLEVLNELKMMRSEAVGLATGKAGAKPRFRKGPATAIEKVRYRIREGKHNDLVARLAPRDERGRRVQPIAAEPGLDDTGSVK